MTMAETDPDYVRFLEQHAGEEYSESETEDEDYNEEEGEGALDFMPLEVESQEAARALPNTSTANSAQQNVAIFYSEEEEAVKRRRQGGGEVCSASGVDPEPNSQGKEWSRSEIDGLFCPVCMEAWTDDGEHHICCLPCGHIFGMSCIKRWLQQRKNSGKCPQCNRKCALKDVRKLYASQLVVVDDESQKRIRYLEAKCAEFEKKDADWRKKEAQWKKQAADLSMEVKRLDERANYFGRSLAEMRSRLSQRCAAVEDCQGRSVYGHNHDLELCGQGSFSSFVLKKEIKVDGARIFDIDAAACIVLLARRMPRKGGTYVLTKMSLMSSSDLEDISLPSGTNAVRDLQVCPHNNGLALFGSLGKKLSILSAESNDLVLSCNLPAPAWSCSWDARSSHLLYAGLQNGCLLVYDMRQTVRPLESLEGQTANPIHTIKALSPTILLPSTVKPVMTASAVGLCQWIEGRPSVIPRSASPEVCISFAYCPGSDEIIASYRPKVQSSNEVALTQTSCTPCLSPGVLGSHILFQNAGSNFYQKVGSTNGIVANVGFPKSAIIDSVNQKRLFAFGEEISSQLILQDVPSFAVVQRLDIKKPPIRDVKFTNTLSHGLLACLGEDTLQLFDAKAS